MTCPETAEFSRKSNNLTSDRGIRLSQWSFPSRRLHPRNAAEESCAMIAGLVRVMPELWTLKVCEVHRSWSSDGRLLQPTSPCPIRPSRIRSADAYRGHSAAPQASNTRSSTESLERLSTRPDISALCTSKQWSKRALSWHRPLSQQNSYLLLEIYDCNESVDWCPWPRSDLISKDEWPDKSKSWKASDWTIPYLLLAFYLVFIGWERPMMLAIPGVISHDEKMHRAFCCLERICNGELRNRS